MKTLLLAQGDLVLGPAGHQTVTGSSKVRQDLALALGEEYGHDRFHREWGSVIQRFIGEPINPALELAIYSEVNRVITAYIQAQRQGLQRDSLTGRLSRYSLADVVNSIQDIKVKSFQDTITVTMTLQTAANETVKITRTVGL